MTQSIEVRNVPPPLFSQMTEDDNQTREMLVKQCSINSGLRQVRHVATWLGMPGKDAVLYSPGRPGYGVDELVNYVMAHRHQPPVPPIPVSATPPTESEERERIAIIQECKALAAQKGMSTADNWYDQQNLSELRTYLEHLKTQGNSEAPPSNTMQPIPDPEPVAVQATEQEPPKVKSASGRVRRRTTKKDVLLDRCQELGIQVVDDKIPALCNLLGITFDITGISPDKLRVMINEPPAAAPDNQPMLPGMEPPMELQMPATEPIPDCVTEPTPEFCGTSLPTPNIMQVIHGQLVDLTDYVKQEFTAMGEVLRVVANSQANGGIPENVRTPKDLATFFKQREIPKTS